MRELDVLLERYLVGRFDEATEAERTMFVALLELPDPLLWSYLTGASVPADPELRALLARIRDAA